MSSPTDSVLECLTGSFRDRDGRSKHRWHRVFMNTESKAEGRRHLQFVD